MVRRKGERPVPRTIDLWSEAHPVARMIAEGDRWFMAWVGQKRTSLRHLERLTGIPIARLTELSLGGAVSRTEVDALAGVWLVNASDLARSAAGTVEIVE